MKEIKRLFKALKYSIAGLRAAWADEPSFRWLGLLAAILLPAAWWLTADFLTRAVLIMPLFLSLIIELFNSAIENVVDYISTERHPLAKKAKDMGSAAQFVGLWLMAIIWLSFLARQWGGE